MLNPRPIPNWANGHALPHTSPVSYLIHQKPIPRFNANDPITVLRGTRIISVPFIKATKPFNESVNDPSLGFHDSSTNTTRCLSLCLLMLNVLPACRTFTITVRLFSLTRPPSFRCPPRSNSTIVIFLSFN